ncbi:MAG: transporter substrate-binding domain-containing protein [Desulfobacter sp.]|nr:transporter substrate-binding domain-containing protein [Desulfobacter sp.]
MLEGYVIDLTHAISRVMSARIVLLSHKLNDPQEYATLHDAEVVLCMVKTAATSEMYDFSPPYAIHSFTIFGRKDAPPPADPARIMENPRIVINEDGVYYDLNRATLNQLHSATATSAEEALRKVSHGEFDYVVLETYIGDQIIERHGLSNVVRLQETREKVEYAFAAPKGNAKVLEIFNQGMAYLQQTGQFDKIQKRWLEKRFLYTKSDRDTLIIYITLGLMVAMSIMLAFFLWSHTLKQQVKQRTTDLETEIAERKKAEQKLFSSQAQLIQADKMAAVGTLASGVAHEINNPNGLILLNMPFIRQAFTDLKPMVQDYCQRNKGVMVAGLPCDMLEEHLDPILNDMLQASQRIKSIVKDLKDFARPDSADWNEDFDFNSVVQTALRLLERMLKKSTNFFQVDYGRNLPLMHGSVQKIEQVVLNLVINACQALPDRSRKITISTFFDRKQWEICLTIRDEGLGIKPDDMSQLFDPFFTTKRGQGGTGLGLSISDTIIKAHHGSLKIQSVLNEGTTVVVRIPRCPRNTQIGENK